MKNILLVISLCFIGFSCDTSKKEEIVKNAELVMYKPSEMALLMNEMYLFNEKTKVKIIKNEDLKLIDTKMEESCEIILATSKSSAPGIKTIFEKMHGISITNAD